MDTEAKTETDKQDRRAAVTIYGHDRLAKPAAAKPRAAGRSTRMALRLMDNFAGAVPMNTAAGTASPEQIALRAWEIWQAEGRPEGRALEHWLQAEKELR